MSMSDELREYADKLDEAAARESEHGFSPVGMRLGRIADRIDAAHQKAEDEWKAKDGKSWLRGYAECRAELMKGSEAIAASLEEAGWVKLPVSGDGETIHVRDVLDGYGKTIEVVEMRYGRSGWVLISRDGNGYADTFAFRHHRAPTVDLPARTPEQALDATLGRGKCRNVSYRLDESRFHCSECGFGCWVKDVADGRDKLPQYCPRCGREVER